MSKALRILNVDDDDAARYVKTRLLRAAGHQIAEAASASEALQALATGEFDLLVLDVKLPDMSGFEVARRVRADSRLRHLAILQVSAICVTSDDEIDGLDSGADAFLSVPFDEQTLAEAAERAMRLRRMPVAPIAAARKLDARVLARVHALARSRMAESLGVADLAGAAGLSVFHFSRLFKATTGETPHAYLQRVRIVESMRLLRDTRMELGDIAGRVGFRTHAHFSRLFRAYTGTAPRDYRATFANAA